jgi:CPA1 family monovalent cation:H+ antiporter
MHSFEIVLALLVAAAALAPVAKKLDVPLAIVHVVGGAALVAVPDLRTFELDPQVAFTLFVPPLLYWAALHTSARDLRRSGRSLFLLAVALVLVTAGAVAVAAVLLVPHLGWGPAFVLGAIVSPPDAAVATAIAHRLGIPKRLVDLLEGETLLNDSTAFVTYNVAIAAVVSGAFSFGGAVLQFGWAVLGGVAFGAAAAGLVIFLRKRLHHTEVENAISLVTPFAAFLPAEHFKASGVLAVLTVGVILAYGGPRIVSARTRVQAQGMWGILSFVLEGLTFLLIGLNLGNMILRQVKSFDGYAIVVTLVVALVCVVVRLAWVFPGTYVPRLVSRTVRDREGWPPWRNIFFLGWAGLRGGDTLVMALAIPLMTSAGAPFPHRGLIMDVAFGVILVTLVVQGLTLRPLARALKLKDPSVTERDGEELEARRHAAEAGRAALHAAAERHAVDTELLERFIAAHTLRTRSGSAQTIEAFDAATETIATLERATLSAERAALLKLHDEGKISDDVLRTVQAELDLEELRIASGEDA